MTIFAIISQKVSGADNLAASIAKVYPQHFYDLGNGVWLVAARGTAVEVSNELGITDGTQGSAVVLETASYYGRANPAIWSWIKVNWEAESG